MTTTALSKIQSADGRSINPRYPAWTHIVPLPPDSLMWSVGGATLEMFVVLGDAWAQLISRYTPADCTVLDIGCGCGRTARLLLNNRSIANYVGFDVIRENVEWCQKFIQPAWHGVCRFHHYDLYSKEYNPDATMRASSLVFPCVDGSVNVCFASSVFTHLLEPDAVHYLREIERVLTPEGVAVLSIHNAVPPGERFVGTESRIDIATEYFLELATSAGLQETERIDDLGGQQVVIFTKRSTAPATVVPTSRASQDMVPPPAGSVVSQVDRYALDQPIGKGPFTFSTGDEVVVSGWAFVDPPGLTPSAVVLQVVSLQTGAVTRVNCERGPRPDVVSCFRDSRLLSSGFTGRICLDPSFRGAYSVRLLQLEGLRSYLSAELFSFTVALASVEADARRQLAAKFLTGAGLEVGALQRRLETPASCTVRYVDRMPLSELRAHYPELRDQPLQAPDLIDDGETLSTVVTGSQDFVIANHFLEHCEDPIHTLGNLARVLKVGGILYMAVPDKRFTFDVDRPVTQYSVLAESRRQHRRLDREAMYGEWVAKVMKVAPPDADAAARRLLDEQYSIHFNVWALPDLLEFLLEARAEFMLPLTLDWVVCSDNEVILVLKKQDGGASVER